jgi:hypothetical protein
MGRVKSLKWGQERILKPRLNRYGYLTVVLCKDKIRKSYTVHRLVCQAFLDNPENKLEVDHINRNSLDNRKENLRLCTHRQNTVNRPALKGANEWGYRGLVRYKASKKSPTAPDNYYWRAKVENGSSSIHAGSNKNPHISALKYNKVALQIYGDFVLLNEVPCFSEKNIYRDDKCSTCNANCFCCCVC